MIVEKLEEIIELLGTRFSKVRDNEIKSKIFDLINIFKEEQVNNKENVEIVSSTKISKFKNILEPIYQNIELEVKIEKQKQKPNIDYSIYQNQVYSALYREFKKQDLYTREKAVELYSNYDYAKMMWNEYLDLVDDINQHRIAFVSDRTIICSYFNITIDMYNLFRNDSNEMISNLFESIEEYIIGFKMSASEVGVRNSKAVSNNMKVIKYGNEVEQKLPTGQIENGILRELTDEEVLKSIQTNKLLKLLGN